MNKNKSHYRWFIVTMLFIAMVINYMDRAALSVAMPFITKSFELTPSEKGMVFSGFFIGYAAFNFIGGYLADRYGPKRVFVYAMCIWSGLCALTALAYSFWTLLIIRALFGVGEGPVPTTANKVVNNWFPIRERARAVGINQAGGPLGGALAGPVIGFLAISLGWQISFVIVGAIGVLWAIAWKFIATDNPADHKRVSPQELKDIQAGRDIIVETDQPLSKPTLRSVLMRPAVLCTGFSLFCYNYTLYFFMTWFPSYLVDTKGVSLQQMSWITAFPWLVGACGMAAGGFLIDKIYQKTGRQLFSRKVVLVTCLTLAAACIGLSGRSESVQWVVLFMSVAIGFLMLTASAYWALIQDTVPSYYVGTAGGLMHGMGNCAGLFAPTLTGVIIQATGTYSAAFVLTGVLGVAGALAVWGFVNEQKHPERQPALSAQ
ncbi:TPA: MFS transporter [Pseudomonas putida]|uniref:MFS transporter n=1 Tax=Pseudomonas TaxID=286 RepID=UPI00110CFC46|nr:MULTISPECIES: MFS transporter [Pseudomonas]MDD1993580.1 MFS transporter [Pseudomonas putida]HDS0916513.1 MFS transporter [Pseudomonas putida]HDS0932148.1 MFS transporter [Pseudomonas putida]HDS1781555.1 MFS transporter [Pseudomonas putida]HDS3797151.1 MFS transporter [Pseudomonas putida]